MNKKPDNSELINEQRALNTMADLLTDICEESSKDKDTNNKYIKPFLSKKIPSISIKQYLERLLSHTKMEISTLILILIYIDKICRNNNFRLNYFNIHKLIITSMLVSIKYNEDEYFSNKFYAKVGGISVKDLDFLEYVFLTLIDFQLFVDEELYNKYSNYILSIKVDE
jgi:hypothetical protein